MLRGGGDNPPSVSDFLTYESRGERILFNSQSPKSVFAALCGVDPSSNKFSLWLCKLSRLSELKKNIKDTQNKLFFDMIFFSNSAPAIILPP